MTTNKPELEHETSSPKFIVGIGASAGGLDALKRFLSHAPSDCGVAYIVVQHLSPDFKSMMDELLQSQTKMPVKMATDFESIAPNTVYLLPERRHLMLASGKIMLAQVDESKIHHPIDYFFKSLAEENQNHAVGVILSGTGNDGSRGIEELNQMGALTLVQDPEDAEFDGMPVSALKTKCVDYLLNAEQMGEKILEFVTSNTSLGDVSDGDNREHLISQYEAVFKHVHKQQNLNLHDYKISTVERRIHHRMRCLGIEKVDDYLQYIDNNIKEADQLANDIMIGVTAFFRDPYVWPNLKETILKTILSAKQHNDSFRVWIPGCASGEEAYTIGILLHELVEELEVDCDIRIFASDIDREAIQFASQGIYSESRIEDVPEEYRKKYFVKTEAGFAVVDHLRKSIVFAVHNVLEDPPFSNMDLISCRNILIYFQAEAQKNILSLLHFALRPHGFLLLGEAESTSCLKEHFEKVDKTLRIYQRKKDSKISLSAVRLNDQNGSYRRIIPQVSKMLKRTSNMPPASSMVTRVKDELFKLHTPPTLVLDRQHNVVYSFGNTHHITKKMQPGANSMHYSNFIIDELVSLVGSLVRQVEVSKERIILADVGMLDGDKPHLLDGTFVEMPNMNGQGHVVISVYPTNQELLDDIEHDSALSNSQVDLRVKQLDAALVDARVLLGEKQQDLEEMTEELQVTNEELMASNEELQSTNEELQSVNEELFTVNTEHQEKIRELESTNNDLDLLLNATNLGVINLDSNLHIRRFTPKIREYINILPLDIDRPFSDITHNFAIDNFNELLREVLGSQKQAQLKVSHTTNPDSNIVLTITPYIDNEQKCDGLIMLFQDISHLMRL